ncbi:hypothetical protein GJAV_G00069510 [Gymnothorax javanicus]|nr:hypothetical protein GJAV_G00069510 [Gymnothorax javanicus]
MSLVRTNRFGRSTGRRPPQSKKPRAPKQEWVSTIHDLNVLKASPEELKRRHELHKSKNRVVAEWEMKERSTRNKCRKTSPGNPTQLEPAHVRIIKELLSDQYQLQDALARSDRALAVVKDLFGDAPPRQTGFPNVTMAPDSGPDPELPVQLRPDPPTSLSLLSQSIMSPQALNEFKDVNERKCSEEEPHVSSIQSCSADPCSRSQQVLPDAVRSSGTRPEPSGSPRQQPFSAAKEQATGKTGSSCNGKQWRAETIGHDSLTENRSSLNLLQCILGEVEAELNSLEMQEPSGPDSAELCPPSLTGFSVSLLRTVKRLARCLRQSREELQTEVQERRRLEEEVTAQRRLIDALTAEMLSLREENLAMLDEEQRCEGEREPRVRAFTDTVISNSESGAEPYGDERRAEELALPPPAHRDSLSPGPAVLLSPPRQRNSLHPNGHSTDCPSLPARGSVLLQQEAVLSQQQAPPQAAILQQISELTQQNSLIRTRLQQLCTQPVGPAGSQDAGSRAAPDRPAQEKTPADPGMEQRLWQLNRQSAEARRRLLQIIEQQTETSVGPASTSVSPILPDMLALLSATADGERTDLSISAPSPNLSPIASSWGCK